MRGGLHYGEGVTQLDHALQCAALCEASGGGPSLIAAALLHDIGHLVLGEEDVAASGIDDRHETIGAAALAGLFGPAVRAPIALHVRAKRYLCLREPGYVDGLSEASRRSLEAQGGAFKTPEAEGFERVPGWRDAVALRRFDEIAKTSDGAHKRLDDYLPLLATLTNRNGFRRNSEVVLNTTLNLGRSTYMGRDRYGMMTNFAVMA